MLGEGPQGRTVERAADVQLHILPLALQFLERFPNLLVLGAAASGPIPRG